MKSKEEWMQKTMVVCLGALVCCLLWGSAFPGIKIGYELFQIDDSETATQILFAGCRFLLAGILALFSGSILNHRVLVPQKKSYGRIVKLSMLQTVGQYIFFYIGLAHTTGVKASIIEAVNVFVAILTASLIFHQEALSKKKMIGSVIGFSGVILVNLAGESLNFSFSLTGDGCIFLSAVAYAFSSVMVKEYAKDEEPLILSSYQFIAGALVMIAAGLLGGGRLDHWSLPGVGMLIYLAFVSAMAYSLWGMLLKYNPVSKVAVFGFMDPVCGVILSAVCLKESRALNGVSLVALILVCAGIYIVNHEPADSKDGS